MQITRWILTAGVPTLIAGCTAADAPRTSKATDEPLQITAGTRISTEGLLSYGAVVFAESTTTLLEAGDFHGYELDGKAGGVVTITLNGASCGAPDTVLDLFGPVDTAGNRTFLIENDDAGLSPCTLDSRITSFTLPATGRYLVVATSLLQQGGGHYKLTVTCNNNACVDPAAPTFAGSQIAQTDIDNGLFTASQLFDNGDFTFDHVFTVPEGVGNALSGPPAGNGPPPNFRAVEVGAFGAPETQSCVTCHNVGGDYGAGDIEHNIFQNTTGTPQTGLPRNPPAVLGSGLRQAIGAEMTAELQNELASAKAQAVATHTAVTKVLTSKGISFGSLVANPDGTVNFAGVVGVDTDLAVKPFGWKGREATLRRLAEGEFRVHLGIQSQPQVTSKCPNTNLLGTGACPDPDGDGVINELTEGHLSAEAVYLGLLQTPVRVPAVSAAAQTRANNGEALFNQVGCATCHTQNMKINNPIHVEAADSVAAGGTGGKGITLNLAVDTHDPKPPVAADGSMTIEVFSDFKRHDVGAALADSKAFNQIAANQFITPPLWGVAVSAPYLHDGRARTLQDAILQHAGDAQAVRNNFAALTADQQSQIVEFLLTLGRQENVDAGKVDISSFLLQQIKTPPGTLTQASFPSGTLVAHGGRVIVARNATQTLFQSFYGRTLDANTLFFNGGNAFPTISGGEQFALFDSNTGATTRVGLDGFTFPEAAAGGQTLQRKDCGLISTQSASWTIVASTPASATPGIAPLSTGQNRICFTEVADSPTNSNFEFIEIFVE